MTRRSALAALFALAAGCSGRASRGSSLHAAPDFALPSLDGRTVRLSQLRGRPVLLNFWATWCAPCRIETPWLVDLYRTYRRRDIEFIGVSLDEPEDRQAVAGFARRMGIAYPVLFGTRDVANAYGGVRLMPQTFLVSRDGAIVQSTIGVTSKDDVEASIRSLLGR